MFCHKCKQWVEVDEYNVSEGMCIYCLEEEEDIKFQ